MDLQSYMPVPPGIRMEENFFSLDDILLSHERLPCRTESAFPRLGFLEKSSETRDIPEVLVSNTFISLMFFFKTNIRRAFNHISNTFVNNRLKLSLLYKGNIKTAIQMLLF